MFLTETNYYYLNSLDFDKNLKFMNLDFSKHGEM